MKRAKSIETVYRLSLTCDCCLPWHHTGTMTSRPPPLLQMCYHSIFFFSLLAFLFLLFFFFAVGYYGMCIFCSIYPKAINACWLFGPPEVTCLRFVMHALLLSQLIVHVPFFAFICADAVHMSDLLAAPPPPLILSCYVVSPVSARDSRRQRGGLLFMGCKDVLSISVAERLELLKPFSGPWSNPGDCCVDATLTAITDKFKRL